MKKEFDFRSISLRHFLVSTVIPILLLFFALSWHDTRQAFSFTQEVYSGTLETSAGTLTASFAELEEISFTPYLYKDVSNAMLYMQNGLLAPDSTPPKYLAVDTLEANYTLLFSKLLHSSRQQIVSISFYPFNAGLGRCFSIHKNTAGLSCSEVDPAQVQYLYEQTVPWGSRPLFVSLDPSESPSPLFSLLRTIKDYDSGKELGLLRIDAQSNVLGTALDDVILTEKGYVTLKDSNGALIYQSGQNDKNVVYTAQTCPVGSSGWTIDLFVANRAFQISNRTSVLIIFFVTLLAYLLALVIYRVRSARTVSSIDAILLAIHQLQQGNLKYHCQVKDDQELKMVADALNDTGNKLDTLIRTEAEACAARSRAEYLALQSQINPHFLSNILNGFIALNRMGERQLLENSIIHLTKLFRYICSNNDTTSVEQEANFVVQYLELQKIRFEDRVLYKINVSPDVAAVQIPKLIVQPLVENCIVHGMQDDDTPILIELNASLDDTNKEHSMLILEISDNGYGFDTSLPSNHVGLDNVTTRLALFHPEAHFQIESKPGMGTTVRLLVPVEGSTKMKGCTT